LNLKTMLAPLAVGMMLALTADVGVAGANGGAPISAQGLVSRIHNSLECLTQWRTLYEANGTTTFKNVLDCVVYAAEGGQFGTPPPAGPVITSVVASGSCIATITGTGFTGTTEVVDSAFPGPATFSVNADGTQIIAEPAFPYTGDSIDLGTTFTVTTAEGTASGANTVQCGQPGGL